MHEGYQHSVHIDVCGQHFSVSLEETQTDIHNPSLCTQVSSLDRAHCSRFELLCVCTVPVLPYCPCYVRSILFPLTLVLTLKFPFTPTASHLLPCLNTEAWQRSSLRR